MKQILLSTFLFSYSLFGQVQITILHTNNINGNLENCLCEDQPLGALEKISFQIDKVRRESKHTLVFDAGDYFSVYDTPEKISLMLKGIKHIQYDALNIGDQEFSRGAPFFEQNILSEQLPYLSLNLFIKKKQPFKQYLILKRGGIRIAVTGLISEATFKFFPEEFRRGITISDPVNSLQKWSEKNQSKFDLLIVLSQLGLEGDKELAEKVGTIDIIVGGHSQDVLKKPLRINNSLIMQAGPDGFYLGELTLKMTGAKKIKDYEYRLMPMLFELPNDPAIVELAIIDNFGHLFKAQSKEHFVDPVPEKYLVSSSLECLECHPAAYERWQEGPHGQSFQSIEKENKSKIFKCMACHVSGFAREKGFININLTPKMANVGCIDCHYTLSSHLQDELSSSVISIEPATCTRCHDKENDPEFDFEQRKKETMQEK